MMSLENYSLRPLQQHHHSLDWDLHSNINGVEYFHELIPLDWESPMSSEASTGYLQDAVAEWEDRCKRRRTTAAVAVAAAAPHRDCTSVGMNEELLDLLQNFWDSSNHGDHHPLDGLNCVSQEKFAGTDHDAANPKLLSLKGHTMQQVSGKKLQEERGGASPPNPKEKDTNYASVESNSTHPSTLKYLAPRESESQRCKKKKGTGVAYPFAVVKPGGLEGDVTLHDINERILMRPARPVRHPVGEFAPGPCVSARGPGLSGKAVVSLTRIHTRGRGTITIIRTRG
uniref:Protein XRI1 n=1 Tax=Ananas comosus var. bracteatus TaxID=296719 RepID=A0A6V7P8L0_ANACO|nr:unnamed protein product [Ananas comosus var. bracteatus]